jgi:hypothetical protein
MMMSMWIANASWDVNKVFTQWNTLPIDISRSSCWLESSMFEKMLCLKQS